MAQHIITTAPMDALALDAQAERRSTAGFGSLVAAAVTTLRKAALEPGMPRMSSEWLNSHDRFSGRRWTN